MIYLWQTPDKYYSSTNDEILNKYIGNYDIKVGQHWSLFTGASSQSLAYTKQDLMFRFNATKLEISEFDILQNDAKFLIVNQRVKQVLYRVASDDVQYLPCTINCIDGELDNYYVLNILIRVDGIDKEKSKCEYFISEPSEIIGFSPGVGTLVYNQNCLGDYQIAREKCYSSLILISQKLQEALSLMHPPLNEAKFILPEETEW